MTIRRNSIISILLTVALTAVFFTFGCEEHDVFTLSQEEEVDRYLTDSDLCRELYRVHGFAGDSVTYKLPDNDTTTYTRFIDSTSRRITVTLNPDGLLKLSIGDYYHATAIIRDYLYCRLRKQISGNTTEAAFGQSLERWAYLVKFGDNNQSYSGWLLQGYADATFDSTTHLTIATTSGDTLDLNYNRGMSIGGETVNVAPGYIDIDDFCSIEKGSQIVFTGCYESVVLVNYESQTGYRSEVVPDNQIGSSCFADTIQTSTTTDHFWNSIYVKSYYKPNDSTTASDQFIVPYRVKL